MQIYKLLFCFLIGLVVSLAFAPLVIKLSQKFKLKQTILHYVELHKDKQGTPTMGGFIFLLGFVVASACFLREDCLLSLVAIAVTLSFCLLGFLDDFIKIKFHQNEGLKPYQKIIGQLGISTIVACFVYFNGLVPNSIVLPFSNITLNLSWSIIPFVIFVMIAISNSVNLTDGLDGLAGGVSFVYLFGFAVLMFIYIAFVSPVNVQMEQFNLVLCAAAMMGGLGGFLCNNCNKAKIFMGDTGSLALGGFVGAIAVFSGLELFIPILGVMFVLSALSDIIQVLHFKRTKKRVFLMAPLHHHFEKKGVHENRIVIIYIFITMAMCVLSIALTLALA